MKNLIIVYIIGMVVANLVLKSAYCRNRFKEDGSFDDYSYDFIALLGSVLSWAIIALVTYRFIKDKIQL